MMTTVRRWLARLFEDTVVQSGRPTIRDDSPVRPALWVMSNILSSVIDMFLMCGNIML